MKKSVFSAIIATLFAFSAKATVLVVKEYGVNATYSSIAAALAAAANNDTIVIYDKPSGQAWLEGLTIDKNLTFLNTTVGSRFKTPGQVTVIPKAGMELYFIGWDLNGNSITASASGATATSANRAKITVTDCINVADINLNLDWIDARVFYNQSMTGTIYFRHGIAVANVLSGGIYTIPESTTAAETDSIIIVGNKARFCFFDTKEAGIIANNYFSNNSAATNWYDPGTGNALSIRAHNQNSNAILSIVNNTILNIGTGTGTRMSSAFWNCGNTSNIKLINNLCYSSGGTTYGIWFEAYSGTPYISHNYINTNGSTNYCSVTFSNELNYTINGANSFGTIDTWGRAASGNTQLINKGNYLGEYYDIDLTRNDIGTYGGPYTIDNYISSNASKARVLYINIKHQLTNLNQILNVKGSAGSKY